MNAQDYQHQPVLLREVIDAMQIRPDGIYVDGTFGRGGHARAILALLNEHGRLLVMDKDPQAIAHARQLHGDDARVIIVHADYSSLLQRVEELGWRELVDGVLLDLGVSSPQLDDPERGFSFQQNGPLDMRMDSSRGLSAAQWLAQAEQKEIADTLWQLGEERYARRIAKKIVQQRGQQAIEDTRTLANLIAQCVPAHAEKKHPATRSFQAIRMRVNQELEHIQQTLEQLFDVLKIGGRLLVISFHSLEDRLIKRFIKKHASAPSLPRGLPLREDEIPQRVRLHALGKAIKASMEEIEHNARARSAVLRVAERVH